MTVDLDDLQDRAMKALPGSAVKTRTMIRALIAEHRAALGVVNSVRGTAMTIQQADALEEFDRERAHELHHPTAPSASR